MDDKTLLLKAASAAGYGINQRGQSAREAEMPNEPSLWLTHATWWNPLTDSGQALDLAVTLELDIGQMLTEGCVTVTGLAFAAGLAAVAAGWTRPPAAIAASAAANLSGAAAPANILSLSLFIRAHPHTDISSYR